MKQSFNALITAAAKNNVDEIKKIHSANTVNLSDCGSDTKRTPLHWAALNGCVEAARYLGEHSPKISINKQDSKGNTPVNLCTQHSTNLLARLATILCLFDLGADPFLSNEEGKTPLMGMVSIRDSKEASASLVAQEQINLIIQKIKNIAITQAREKNQSIHITKNGTIHFIDTRTPLSATFLKKATPLVVGKPSADPKDLKIQSTENSPTYVSNCV